MSENSYLLSFGEVIYSSPMKWGLAGALFFSLVACEVPGFGDDPIPDNNYCEPVISWPSGDSDLEEQVFALVNQRRSEGANCGGENFGPTSALEQEGALTCAARVHSKDMVDRNYFSHNNPDGNSPGWRIDQAGFAGGRTGENIAAGQTSAAQVMDGWMNSPGHCRNIMNPAYDYIGIGHHERHWTQTFGGN